MSKTKWFIRNSRSYMAGINPTPYQWIRAYIRFMWLSRKDKTSPMTNVEKQELRMYCAEGLTFQQIRNLVSCSDSTIREYLKVFAPKPTDKGSKP